MGEVNGARVVVAAWDDRESLIGEEFVSDWLQVDDEHVDQFEAGSYVTEGPNGLNARLYPAGLVEGFHLLSLLDYLVNGVSYLTDANWSGWNYGLDRVRFVSPVTIADRIRVRGYVKSMEPRGDDVLVLYHCTLEVEEREKPGMTAEWRVLWTMVAEEG